MTAGMVEIGLTREQIERVTEYADHAWDSFHKKNKEAPKEEKGNR